MLLTVLRVIRRQRMVSGLCQYMPLDIDARRQAESSDIIRETVGLSLSTWTIPVIRVSTMYAHFTT